MTFYHFMAIVLGTALGIGIAMIPLTRQYREQEKITDLLEEGLISVNQARQMKEDFDKLPWRCRWFGHAMRLPPGMYVMGEQYTMRCKRCGHEDEYDDFWIERS